jgi:hypothetical protein
MADSNYTLTAGGDNVVTPDRSPMFYVVSGRKLTILFLVTLGLYTVYWFYKNWDRYKDKWPYASEVGTTIWPVPRAVFSVFFVHALFRKIKANAQENAAVAAWRNNLHAWLLVILLLVSSGLDRAANKSIGSPWTDVLSLAILAPLLFQLLKAQEMINISCNDPAGAGNGSFSKVNYAWIVAGVVLWVLIIIGFFLPD